MAVPAQAAPARPAPAAAIPPGNQPAPRNLAVTPRAARAKAARPEPSRVPAVPARARKTPPAADPDPIPAPPAAPAEAAPSEDDEIPAYAKPRPKASNLGEIILRNSVQAAANIDKDNLTELSNRYALGFPGLSGEVVIGLTIDPGGRILEGSIVSTTTGVEAFDQELLRRVLDWHLRAFPDTRPKFISVPFLFPQQGGH
jgi:TonB family protein